MDFLTTPTVLFASTWPTRVTGASRMAPPLPPPALHSAMERSVDLMDAEVCAETARPDKLVLHKALATRFAPPTAWEEDVALTAAQVLVDPAPLELPAPTECALVPAHPTA